MRTRPRGYSDQDLVRNYPGDNKHFCSIYGPGCLFRWNPTGFFPDGIMIPISWDHPTGWENNARDMVPVCIVCHALKDDTAMNKGKKREHVPCLADRDRVEAMILAGFSLTDIGRLFIPNRAGSGAVGRRLVIKYRLYHLFKSVNQKRSK